MLKPFEVYKSDDPEPATRGDIADLRDQTQGMMRLIMDRFDAADRRFDKLDAKLLQLRAELSAEFAQHARAITDELRGHISLVDEKHNDLPRRVTKLEAQMRPAAARKPKRKRRPS